MARRRARGRNINGILLLNKSTGVTSNGALQVAKRLVAGAKAGHTGSLDPLATGMLPLCFGEATKFSQFLLDADKTYQVTAKLGVITETGDADGDVVSEQAVTASAEEITAALLSFVGDIEQVPSMYSAIKHQGQPLYKLAREGIEVERKVRPVTIYRIDNIAVEGDEVHFLVACSKGTYVRTLVEDLGQKLGCGGHVTALHRTEVGPFTDEPMYSMDDLGATKQEGGFEALDALLLPIDAAVRHWPAVHLGPDASYYIRQGQPVMAADRPASGWVRLYSEEENEFIGVGEVQDDGMIAPRRLLTTN